MGDYDEVEHEVKDLRLILVEKGEVVETERLIDLAGSNVQEVQTSQLKCHPED